MDGRQREVLIEIISAIITIIVVFAIAFYVLPHEIEISLAKLVGISLLPMAFWLILFIGIRAKQRFFNLDEIDGGPPSVNSSSEIQTRVLQNTFEQLLLALPIFIGFVFINPPYSVVIIPVLSGLFFVGRLFFWLGYQYSPVLRGYGFALTFYPLIFAFIYLLISFFVSS